MGYFARSLLIRFTPPHFLSKVERDRIRRGSHSNPALRAACSPLRTLVPH
jgi:hypothetical protein